MRPILTLTAAAVIAAFTTPTARADEESLRREFDEKLRRALDEQEKRHKAEIDALRRQVGGPASGAAPTTELQDRIDDLAAEVGTMKSSFLQTERKGVLRLVDVSLNALFVAGTSSGTEAEIQELNQGGHDPQKRGFTVPNVELVLSGAVDPYFIAQANVVTLLSPEGETVVELEEAFATTTSLPWGMQVKAGQFFTNFGRHNPQHPHQWEFVNAPVANTRILGGDGLRGPGVQTSWLAPFDLPLEFSYSLQNANGETATSFLSSDEAGIPAGAFVEREVRSLHDVVHVGRAAVSIDATDEMPILFGVSGAFGPSGATSGGDARVLGADFTLKYKPLTAEAGFPFVALRGEVLARDYEFDDAGSTDELEDSGWYAQAVWGFRRNWTAALRYDSFRGDFGGRISGLDDRTRMSAALTWYTSEFAKIRLQVDRDDARSTDGEVTAVWLQLEFNIGAHGAHKF